MNNYGLITHLINADDYLTQFTPIIQPAIAKAEKQIYSDFKIDWSIDVIVTSGIPEFCGPEGVGGKNRNQGLVFIDIDEAFTDHPITEAMIFQTLCHELYHAVKLGLNPQDECNFLLDDLLHEGFATLYEEYVTPEEQPLKNSVAKIIDSKDSYAKKLLTKLPPLDTKYGEYDVDAIFGDGKQYGYGYGAGYYVGYYLAKKYLAKTGKNVIEALHDGNAVFGKAFGMPV